MRTAAPLLIFALIVVVGYFVVSHRYSGFRSQQSKEDRVRASELSADIELLIPLNEPLAEPGPMDWLATHTEKKQTFAQYTRSGPVRPRGARDTIYVQPLGDFSEKERKIVELTTAFLTSYFSCPVRLNDALPSSTIPADKRRLLSAMGQEQILSGYVLNDVLKPRLPNDGAAIIALTSMDLWPGEGWNFVFGQASLKERVGVWSMSRFGDPEASEEAFRLCLLRTLKVATHETGHMFSLPHCVLYECNMCGSNHLKETDRHPLALCPECNAKLCWATSSNPVKRYRSLEQFSRAHGLVAEADRYQKFIKAIDAAKQDK